MICHDSSKDEPQHTMELVHGHFEKEMFVSNSE